jgi:dihydrolipoamide dehydrogenase
MRKVEVAIIGAGTAGLTARSTVAKQTDSYAVIDPGPLGTLCARVGCMPSKALLHVARQFESIRHPAFGLPEGRNPDINGVEVLRHVRQQRDRFVGGVLKDMKQWQDQHLISRKARFIDAQTLDLEGERLRAESVVIATGSRPVMPKPWQAYSDRLVNSDSVFDLEDLPASMAVIGLGPLGIELAQAMQWLGVNIVGMGADNHIGGLSDPELLDYAAQHFSREINLCFAKASIDAAENGTLQVSAGNRKFAVERALIAAGREPVIDGLGLENLGVELDKKGLPAIDSATLQVDDLPVFMAGDVNGIRTLQHEAVSEGRIVGLNALQESASRHHRLTRLSITFCTPNIAVAGCSHQELLKKELEFLTGSVSFEHQGRATLMGENSGMIRVYAAKKDKQLLGAELFAPGGEHLAHLIAWAIAQRLTANELLKMPFYHPVLEEGLRTAINDVARQ